MAEIKTTLLPDKDYNRLCLRLAEAITNEVTEADATDVDTLIALSRLSNSITDRFVALRVMTGKDVSLDKIDAMELSITETLSDVGFNDAEAVALSVRLFHLVMEMIR